MGRVICLVMGYVFGLFQTGYLYGKMNHIDIRNYGSGNSGTTNALRVMGKKAGLIVFAGDFLKTVFACLAARIIFKGSPDTDLYVLYAGLGVVLGHNFPVLLKLQGRKGDRFHGRHSRVHGLARDTCLCSTVPWSCHHYKICLPWFYSGGDLILYPDTGLRGAWNIYRLCGSSHGVLCRCLRPDGDGDLETQDEHKKTFIRHREQALGRKEKLNKRLSTKISVSTGQ